ncbi:MAG TPA: polysaccharide biosynthesis C-terminal domain-containing protein [Sedimentisphaerales bacterium]|nr:polysaccharide biosynthesis C-terminal domain-containing protein [Sedimentisphaerales bacterium]
MLGRIGEDLKQGKTLLQFGFLNGLGQAFGMIAPLVVAKFFASAELYASYSYAKMIVFFFSTLLIAASQAPFIVFANQEKAETGKINKAFSVQLSFFVLSFLIFFGITLPFNKHLVDFAKIDPVDSFFVMLAFVGLALKSFICNLFMAMGQRIRNSLAELIFGATTLLLVFVLYWTAVLNLRTVLAVYLAAALIVVVLSVKVIDFNQLLPFGLDRRLFKDMLNFTKWVVLGATAVYFIHWGHNIVLRLFESLGVVSWADIGSCNLAYQIFKGLATLTFVVNAYFLPFISQHIEDSSKIRVYLYNKRPKIFLLGLVFIGTIFVAAPYFLGLIFAGRYEGSAVVLRTLLIANVLVLWVIFYAPILNALKKYRFTQTSSVIQLLLSVLLALLLVPVIGMVGAAVATVLACFCQVVIIETYFRVKLKKVLKL